MPAASTKFPSFVIDLSLSQKGGTWVGWRRGTFARRQRTNHHPGKQLTSQPARRCYRLLSCSNCRSACVPPPPHSVSSTHRQRPIQPFHPIPSAPPPLPLLSYPLERAPLSVAHTAGELSLLHRLACALPALLVNQAQSFCFNSSAGG